MTTGALYINDRDVEDDFEFYTSNLAGWPGNLSAANRTVPLLTGPEMPGAILDPRQVQRQAATATAAGIIITDSAADGLAKLDALRALLGQGEVAIRTFHAPDRECLAVCSVFEGRPEVPQVLDGNVIVALSFVVPSGVAQSITPELYALTTSPTETPLGTAESRPVIIVHGGGAALTNPVVTIRNGSGTVVQTCGFTVSLGANDAIRIDCARASVSKIASGVVTDALQAGYWTSGDYGMVLRPYDGNPEGGVYPSVELSSSTGTAVGEISYRRRYV